MQARRITVCFLTSPEATETYTLSLHDALPIFAAHRRHAQRRRPRLGRGRRARRAHRPEARRRSEEHTSELQSHSDLVCRLLLEKKKDNLSSALRALHNFMPLIMQTACEPVGSA